MPVKKICEICQKHFFVKPNRIKTAKFCSNKCRYIGIKEILKGKIRSLEHCKNISKAKKGKHSNPATEFKKGCQIGKKTQFKKGHKLSKEHIRTLKKLGKQRYGKSSHWWKGGKTKTEGYIRFNNYNPKIQKRHRPLEHRTIMGKFLGRKLTKKEVVHHINLDKSDNRIENLMLFENIGYHMSFHRNNAFQKLYY